LHETVKKFKVENFLEVSHFKVENFLEVSPFKVENFLEVSHFKVENFLEISHFEVENFLEVSHFNSVAHSRNSYEHQWGGGGVGIYLFIFFCNCCCGAHSVYCSVHSWGLSLGVKQLGYESPTHLYVVPKLKICFHFADLN